MQHFVDEIIDHLNELHSQPLESVEKKNLQNRILKGMRQGSPVHDAENISEDPSTSKK